MSDVVITIPEDHTKSSPKLPSIDVLAERSHFHCYAPLGTAAAPR
ncbi:hypothetical protein [Methylobacterium nigriterrae]